MAMNVAHNALFFNHEQTCSAGSRTFVHEDIYEGSWRYLWRIRRENYGTSSEKNSWRPFWRCYDAGTPGETPKCLRINQYVCNLLGLLFFLFSSKKHVFWHFSRRGRCEICSTINLKIKTPLASFWPLYC